MLTTLGASSLADRLTVVMTRQRTSQYPPRSDPETTITRAFTLPTARTFTLSGSGQPVGPHPRRRDRPAGRRRTPAAATGLADAYSSGRLPGDLQATASATLDGNASTAWQPGLGTDAEIGASLTYDLTKPRTLTGLTLQVIADGRHSVPTAMTMTSGSGDAHGGAAPHRRQHRPRRGDDRAGLLPRRHRLALRPHLHRHPAGVRGELLLGGATGPAPGHRRGRHPRRAVGPDAGRPARDLRLEPPLDRRPADRRRRRRVDPARPRQRRVTAGALRARRQGDHAGCRPPHRPDGSGAQPTVRQRPDHLHRLEHRPVRPRLGGRGRTGAGGRSRRRRGRPCSPPRNPAPPRP